MPYWYPFKITRGQAVPVDGAKAIESPTPPPGNFWGPFHCAECADTCANYGKTEEQAYQFSHGTDDEKFCVFLGYCE